MKKELKPKLFPHLQKPEPKPSPIFEIKRKQNQRRNGPFEVRNQNQGLLWNWGTGQHYSANQ
jgi:hypothetical protein